MTYSTALGIERIKLLGDNVCQYAMGRALVVIQEHAEHTGLSFEGSAANLHLATGKEVILKARDQYLA